MNSKLLPFFMVFFLEITFAKDIPTLFKEVCANCHGINGERNDAFKAIGGLSVDELIKSIKLYKDGGDKYGMGIVMEGRVEDLTDKEIEEMAKYIHTLKGVKKADSNSSN
jgi:cytochrome c553